MDEILQKSIPDMAGSSFACSCGRQHSVDIHRIIIGRNIEKDIVRLISDFGSGSVFLMADSNTYEVYGEKLYNTLQADNIKTKSYVFPAKGQLVPDEKALGRLLVEIDSKISVIVSIGSGTLNDLARILSSRLKIPYIIAGTAPSMDGYASVVSPLIIDGTKVTYSAVSPYAVAADIEVMKTAPMDMIHAGFGDILGKYTALADWELSRIMNGEYYCETSVKLVRNALKKCSDNAERIPERSESAIGYLIEALVLTGVAMGLTGNSRPASGAEHHLSHYWEISALSRGIEHPLHGNSVGVGAVISSSIYEMMEEYLPEGFEKPDRKQIEHLLKLAGSKDNPRELGIEKEVFRQSVLHAMEIRDRYTILSLASKTGKLGRIANILTERFYD